jgi:hypothetical protein
MLSVFRPDFEVVREGGILQKKEVICKFYVILKCFDNLSSMGAKSGHYDHI